MSYLPITKDTGDHDVVGNPDLELREQDRWLPIANVARLMKSTLPPTAKVSKDAKECMQECVSEFISFITSEASDKCLREKRKTINGEDILYSLHDLGFENYAEVLKIYLAKYREQQAMKQERGKPKTARGSNIKTNTPELEENNNLDDNIGSHDSRVSSLHNIPFSGLSPKKELPSPEFFERYDGDAPGDENDLGGSTTTDPSLIKQGLDMPDNLLMNDKQRYKYCDYISNENNSTQKNNENNNRIEQLEKLDGTERDLDNLGEGMEGRTYF